MPLNLAEPSLPVSGAPGVKLPSAFPLDMMSTVVPAPPVKVMPVVLNVRLVTFQFPSRHGRLLPRTGYFALGFALCLVANAGGAATVAIAIVPKLSAEAERCSERDKGQKSPHNSPQSSPDHNGRPKPMRSTLVGDQLGQANGLVVSR